MQLFSMGATALAAVWLFRTAPVWVQIEQAKHTLAEIMPYSQQAQDMAPVLVRAAVKVGVPWQIVCAVAWQESSFNPRAVSDKGAVGLMQLTTAAVRDVETERHVYLHSGKAALEPATNAYFGAAELAILVERWGSWRSAFGHYFWGSVIESTWYEDQVADKVIRLGGSLE